MGTEERDRRSRTPARALENDSGSRIHSAGLDWIGCWGVGKRRNQGVESPGRGRSLSDVGAPSKKHTKHSVLDGELKTPTRAQGR